MPVLLLIFGFLGYYGGEEWDAPWTGAGIGCALVLVYDAVSDAINKRSPTNE